MARSFNEKMEKKRQAEYNPVWHRRNHWLLKYEEDSTWEDSRAYNAAGELIRTEAELQIDTAGSI